MSNIKKTSVTKPHGEYVKEVKNLLSKEAFSPAPQKLYFLFGYFLILFATYFLFRYNNNVLYYFLLTCICTHCLSSVGFLAHELSHNSITRNRKLRYILEVISWGINLVPATMWDRVHN